MCTFWNEGQKCLQIVQMHKSFYFCYFLSLWQHLPSNPPPTKIWLRPHSITLVAKMSHYTIHLKHYGRHTSAHTYKRVYIFISHQYVLWYSLLTLISTDYDHQSEPRALHSFHAVSECKCFSAFSPVFGMSAVSSSEPILSQFVILFLQSVWDWLWQWLYEKSQPANSEELTV